MRISYLVAGAAVVLVTAPVAAVAMPAHQAHSTDGTVTSRTVKNNSITGADVKNHSLTGADIKSHSVGWNALAPTVKRQLGASVDGLSVTRVTKIGIDSNPADTSYAYSVSCPAGATVLSGGAWAMLPGMALVGTYPGSTSSATDQAWTGRVTQPADADAPLTVEVWAVCAADPS